MTCITLEPIRHHRGPRRVHRDATPAGTGSHALHVLKVLPCVVGLLLLAASPVAAGSGPDGQLAVGDAAPSFAGKDSQGRPFKSDRHIGKGAKDPRAALVVIFADPDEPASARETNELNKLESEWRKLDVALVHIGLGLDRTTLTEFTRKHYIPWVALPDKKKAIAKKFGVERAPHLVIIASDGTIAYVSTSLSSDRYDILRKTLAEVTGRPAPWGAEGRRRSVLLNYEKKYTFGRPPSDPGAAVRWQPLAMIVGRAANAYVSMASPDTYAAYESALAKGEYELADAGPTTGYKIADKYEPLVVLERRNKTTYRGVLFARRDAGVTKVAELKGKTLALVSEKSASGGVFPVAELLKAGLQPDAQVRILWVGSHTAVAEAVSRGKAHAGACYDDCRAAAWPDEEKRERATRIIGLTDDIPAEMIFARRDLPKAEKQRIRDALLGAGARNVLLGHISVGETLVSGVSKARPDQLAKLDKLLSGVPEAMAKARKLAAERRAREAKN